VKRVEETKLNFDINQYVGIVVRRKWFFIIPFASIYFFFIVLSLILPRFYQADAKIIVEERNVANPLLKSLSVSTPMGSRLDTLREEILAWPRVFELVERMGLVKGAKSPIEIERLISSVRKGITLTMRANSIVVISYLGREPKSTQQLVNTLCDILIQRNISLQNEDTTSAIDFINDQLAIYKGKLDTSEATLRKFKEVYGSETRSAAGSNSLPPDEDALNKINKELSSLEAELVMATVDNTELHPRVIGLKQRIEALKTKRNQYIQEVSVKAGVEPEAYVKIADSLPRQQEEMTRLTRDRKINEEIYATLLEKLESAKITDRLDNSDNRTKFRIVEPARLPLEHVKPNKLKFNLMGLVLGLLVGFGCVYALEYADSSFKNEDELKEMFGLPVLGNISRIGLAKEDPGQLAVPVDER
jgi:polysaccharide biosynthesis transport protein